MKKRCFIVVSLIICLFMVGQVVFAEGGKEDPDGDQKELQKPAEGMDQVVIWDRVMYPGDSAWYKCYKNTYDNMMKAIGRNAEVVIDLMPWEGSDEKWKTAFLAGEPPDIGRHLFGGKQKLIDEGILVEAGKWLTEEDRKSISEKELKAMTEPDGKMYGWPSSTRYGPTTWAINVDLVREAGFDPEAIMNKGWTYDDVIAIAKKCNKVDVPEDQKVYGFGNAGERAWRVGYLVYQARGKSIETLGEGLLNPKGEYAKNDKASFDYMEFYYDLMYKHKVWPRVMLGLKMDQVDQMFLEGKIAIIDQGGGICEDAKKWNLSVAAGTQKGKPINAYPVILPRPSYLKEHVARFYTGSELFVFRSKIDKGPEHMKNVQAAYRLLFGPLGQSRVAMFYGIMPSFIETREAYASLIDPSDPKIAVQIMLSKIAIPGSQWPKMTEEQSTAYGKLEVIHNDMVTQLMTGNITPEQFIKRGNEEAEKLGFKIAATSIF